MKKGKNQSLNHRALSKESQDSWTITNVSASALATRSPSECELFMHARMLGAAKSSARAQTSLCTRGVTQD